MRLLNWSARQADDGSIRLSATDPSLSIDLTLTVGRGPFLEGPAASTSRAAGPGGRRTTTA